jgi:hypothetical protein
MRSDFAAFIVTHKRANSVVTDSALRRSGYTGKVFYVVDDEDDQLQQYIDRYSDRVVVFRKSQYVKECDSGNNFGRKSSILFARNACYDVARGLGLKYFWQLDDDYTCFAWACRSDGNPTSHGCVIRGLDDILEACICFLRDSGALTVAFAQGGDFAGGASGKTAQMAAKQMFMRKAMNSFICDVDRPIRFRGVFNEDVSTYTELGRQGHLFFTVPRLRITQKQTQSQQGGITELYVDCGTYVKSFSTVMYAPSCTRIVTIGNKFRRIHHQIRWANVSPKIISEKYRKVG